MTFAPTKYGDQVTADHLISNREDCQGVEGSAYAVVIFGIGTRYLECYPPADKGATEARLSLQDFIGPWQTVSSFPCDGAKELYRAAVDLGLCPARHAHTFRSRIPLPSDKYGMSRKVPAHCSNSMVLHLHSGHTRLDAFASPRTRGITKPDPRGRNTTSEDPSQAFAYLSDH